MDRGCLARDSPGRNGHAPKPPAFPVAGCVRHGVVYFLISFTSLLRHEFHSNLMDATGDLRYDTARLQKRKISRSYGQPCRKEPSVKAELFLSQLHPN